LEFAKLNESIIIGMPDIDKGLPLVMDDDAIKWHNTWLARDDVWIERYEAENLASQNFFWLVRDQAMSLRDFMNVSNSQPGLTSGPPQPDGVSAPRRLGAGQDAASGVQSTVGRLYADPGPS
jgi:hypothetical protein